MSLTCLFMPNRFYCLQFPHVHHILSTFVLLKIVLVSLFIQDPHVESYRMDDIFNKLKLDRERLVGLAVMLGCDYLPKGVAGVGREQVMKLIATLQDKESLLRRFSFSFFRYCDALSVVFFCSYSLHFKVMSVTLTFWLTCFYLQGTQTFVLSATLYDHLGLIGDSPMWHWLSHWWLFYVTLHLIGDSPMWQLCISLVTLQCVSSIYIIGDSPMWHCVSHWWLSSVTAVYLTNEIHTISVESDQWDISFVTLCLSLVNSTVCSHALKCHWPVARAVNNVVLYSALHPVTRPSYFHRFLDCKLSSAICTV